MKHHLKLTYEFPGDDTDPLRELEFESGVVLKAIAHVQPQPGISDDNVALFIEIDLDEREEAHRLAWLPRKAWDEYWDIWIRRLVHVNNLGPIHLYEFLDGEWCDG